MWQFLETVSLKHLISALRILPLVITVILLAPCWLSWVFLPERRQRRVIDLVRQLVEWTRATHGGR